MNRWIGMGRLTKDPELRYTSTNNTAVCSMTIAVDRPFAKKEDEVQADFIPCVIWDKKGEAAAKHLGKGRMVAIDGRIQTRTWDDDEGKRHYVTEIIVENWYFADSKKNDGSGDNQGQEQNSPPQQNNQQGQSAAGGAPPWKK